MHPFDAVYLGLHSVFIPLRGFLSKERSYDLFTNGAEEGCESVLFVFYSAIGV